MAMPGRAHRLTQSGLVLGCALLCGCRWLPLQRPNTAIEPHSSQPGPAPGDATPALTPAPEPLEVTGSDAALPPWLVPVPDHASYVAELREATPLLDAAFERVQAIESEAAPHQPTSMKTRAPGDTAREPQDPEGLRIDPQVVPAVVTAEEGGPEPATTAKAAPDIVPTRQTPRPEPSARAPASVPPAPSPDESWRDGLESLLGLAREQALREAEAGRAGLWSAREQLLARLAGADHSLWNTVLEALAEPTSPSSRSPDPAPAQPAKPEVLPPRLAVSALTFCRTVEGFGNFEPLPPDSLKAGRPLGLYWEVEGLEIEIDGPWHRTRLASSLEVLDAGGTVAWSRPLGQAEDACRRPRRDYFVNTKLTLPETLKPGPYVLRLKLDDRIGGSRATAELDFAIAP
jgi:hypothetical protein